MVIVREVFIAKPGMASTLAKMFKEEMGPRHRILTDMIGRYNTVVVEAEYETVAAWEKEMQEYMNQAKPTRDPSKPSYTDMFTHGRREVYRTW